MVPGFVPQLHGLGRKPVAELPARAPGPAGGGAGLRQLLWRWHESNTVMDNGACAQPRGARWAQPDAAEEQVSQRRQRQKSTTPLRAGASRIHNRSGLWSPLHPRRAAVRR